MTDRSQPPDDDTNDRRGERGQLIYCGMCGALNPANHYYCAACGTTLVDAFHATEGLRVYERADSAARLITIVPSGTELDIVEDPTAPEDFVRVQIEDGRLGYIRLQEVEALAEGQYALMADTPDVNTNARGCVSTTSALGALTLAVVVTGFLFVVAIQANTYDQGTLALIFCAAVGPLLLLTILFYLYARSRENRFHDEADVPGDTNEAPDTAPGD